MVYFNQSKDILFNYSEEAAIMALFELGSKSRRVKDIPLEQIDQNPMQPRRDGESAGHSQHVSEILR